MKKIKLLAAATVFFIMSFTSSAGIVSVNCYTNINYVQICESTTETLAFDITGKVDSYTFEAGAIGSGQGTAPLETKDIIGSLDLTIFTTYTGEFVDTTTITGSFELKLSNLPDISYNAEFSQDAYTGRVTTTFEDLTGIDWRIQTPTLWELLMTVDGGISLNTIENTAMGSYPGFNPLDGILTGANGNVSFDVTSNGTLSAVPVPAAVWLFGSGLIGLAGFARRKNHRLPE